MASAKKFYAVARGRKPGIYDQWFGPDGAEVQIKGFENARFKGFATLQEAEAWLVKPGEYRPRGSKVAAADLPEDLSGWLKVYSDGSSLGNPGPGGYGTVIETDDGRQELAGGYRLTTNNRMELMGCIAALRVIDVSVKVVVTTDSQYVVKGIMNGWARKWRAQGWMRTKTDAAENYDLWEELLKLTEEREVVFRWIKGHAGHRQNERCDELARLAASGAELLNDDNYEQGRTKVGLFDNPKKTRRGA